MSQTQSRILEAPCVLYEQSVTCTDQIKCHMVDSKPPCSRCRNRKLSCTVNKSIQMLLESDIEYGEDQSHSCYRIVYLIALLVGKS